MKKWKVPQQGEINPQLLGSTRWANCGTTEVTEHIKVPVEGWQHPPSMAAARHKTAHDNVAAPLGNQDTWLRKYQAEAQFTRCCSLGWSAAKWAILWRFALWLMQKQRLNVKNIYIHTFFLIWSQGNFSQAQQHRHHCYNVNRATGVFLETGDFPRSILRITFFLNAKREMILIISSNICITNNENSRLFCCERVIEIYPSAKYASVDACIADCDK